MASPNSKSPYLRARSHHKTSALVLMACVAAAFGCSKSSNRVPVQPVSGTIHFKGQPPVGAFVSLVPKSPIDGTPAPRASVGSDGTFALSTYDGSDGAPEGDYVVTIQWFKPVRQGNDLIGGPNVLPGKYASAKTSDLTIHVAAGENHLQPIQLR